MNNPAEVYDLRYPVDTPALLPLLPGPIAAELPSVEEHWCSLRIERGPAHTQIAFTVPLPFLDRPGVYCPFLYKTYTTDDDAGDEIVWTPAGLREQVVLSRGGQTLASIRIELTDTYPVKPDEPTVTDLLASLQDPRVGGRDPRGDHDSICYTEPPSFHPTTYAIGLANVRLFPTDDDAFGAFGAFVPRGGRVPVVYARVAASAGSACAR